MGTILQATLCIAILLVSRQATCSYLDVPRIHFQGNYRADVNTRNNDPCNFDINNPFADDAEWNFNGTNEWQLEDTIVTSVIGSDGAEVVDSPLLGMEIFTNEDRPFGKVVDIDVDFQVTTVYGVRVGAKLGGQTLFVGNWQPSVIVNDMWANVKCFDSNAVNHHSAMLGVQSTTTISDIQWSSNPAVQSLKTATMCSDCTGELSVAMAITLYSQSVFTMGRVVGTIGAAKVGEALCIGGERKFREADPGTITFPSGSPCYGVDQTGQVPWMYGAPFKVDVPRSTLVVDLSNAIPIQLDNEAVDLGALYFGVADGNGVTIYGEPIDYTNPSLLNKGRIVEYSLSAEELSAVQINQLVIALETSGAIGTGAKTRPVKSVFPSMKGMEQIQIIMEETEYFVRPINYYIDRLEYTDPRNLKERDTSEMTLLVTHLGQPEANAHVTVGGTCNQQGLINLPLPANGIVPDAASKQTDSSGLVSFKFHVDIPIPFPREYTYMPCSDEVTKDGKNIREKFAIRKLKNSRKDITSNSFPPVEGQLYNFVYCVGENCAVPSCPDNLYNGALTFLAYSTVTETGPFNWVDNVKPLFEQVHHLHFVMRNILDLSNYTEVTLPRNLQLLKMSFSQDFLHPNYMPVTRDVSPTTMIKLLEWLDDPIYSSVLNEKPVPSAAQQCQPPASERLHTSQYYIPPRCWMKNIPYTANPEEHDSFFHKIFEANQARFDREIKKPPRPLFGLDDEKSEITRMLKNLHVFPQCNVENLRLQLRDAVQIEFYTIPAYLTALYSIVDGCNSDAYDTIRNVVMQEMLHFTLAGNLLIAVGGTLDIDTASFAPSYPHTGLPSGVLPNLYVNLAKLDLRHVHDVFMGIETPMLTFIDTPQFTLHTIGQFYKEVMLCMQLIESRGEEQLFKPNPAENQVSWPWTEPDDLGQVYIVTDMQSAKDAIDQIVEQGEGASPLDPIHAETSQYGHFFRFEEIVCQKRLVATNDGYSYTGPAVPFQPEGVWPMRDNPGKDHITPGTDCYREARAFHHAYRALLRILHETFNGSPEKISNAVELMESLQVHCKKTMSTYYDDATTCGPVWDYDWDPPAVVEQ